MKKCFLALITVIGILLVIVGLKHPEVMRSGQGAAGVVSAEPPVILIHGFNHSSDFWDGIDLIEQLEEKNHILVGEYYADDGLELRLRDECLLEPDQGQSACYKLSLPAKGTKGIRESAILLKEMIQLVTEQHQCKTVRLVAFSAGGVVCREYLTKHLQDHKVESLITISAPHLGSEHAWLAEGYHDIRSLANQLESDRSGNALVKGSRYYSAKGMQAVTRKLERWSQDAGVDIDSECARMLARPEGGNYLAALSSAPHPQNVKYHCIITEENIFNYDVESLQADFRKLKRGELSQTDLATTVLDLGRTGLGKLDKISEQFSSLKYRGDGVVSEFSQDLNNTEAFRNESRLRAETTRLKTRHGGQEILDAILDVMDLE